jgi:predicted alpha/beta superfamily hydrolase
MTKTYLRGVALFVAMLCAVPATPLFARTAAKPPAAPAVEWHDVTAPTGGEYRVMVWAPTAPPPASGYPVVYVVDGNAWGPLVAAMINVDSSAGAGGAVTPAIVVGIGYPIDGAFDLKRRMWDLTTPSERHRQINADRNGGYEAFFNLIENVVKPGIVRRYTIDRTRQTLMGHSLGGEFTLRTLINHPAAFQNYVALSPSIWWDDVALLKDAEAITPDPAMAGNTRVYLGVGEFEQHMSIAYRTDMMTKYREHVSENPDMLQGRSLDQAMSALIAHGEQTKMVDNARAMQFALASKGYATRFDSFPEEDHFSVVPAETSRALRFVLKP